MSVAYPWCAPLREQAVHLAAAFQNVQMELYHRHEKVKGRAYKVNTPEGWKEYGTSLDEFRSFLQSVHGLRDELADFLQSSRQGCP